MERVIPKAALPPLPKAPLEPQSRPVARSRPAPRPKWHQAYLVPLLLKQPPVRRRGDPPEAGLEPFEFVLGGTACLLARVKIARRRHLYASKKAKQAIDGARNYKMKPDVTNRALFQRIGREAYRKAFKSFRWPTIPVEIELSQRELFRIAGLSRNAANLHRLRAALDRLTLPTKQYLPPMLLTHGEAEDGYLRLEVNPQWVPRGGHDPVPWPPPAAPIVLRLYLFCFGTDQRSNTSISLETLYKRVGIPKRHGWQSLCRALKSVNEHLAWLGRQGMFDKTKPSAFALVLSRDGKRVHISAQHQENAAQSPDVDDIADASMRRAM